MKVRQAAVFTVIDKAVARMMRARPDRVKLIETMSTCGRGKSGAFFTKSLDFPRDFIGFSTSGNNLTQSCFNLDQSFFIIIFFHDGRMMLTMA